MTWLLPCVIGTLTGCLSGMGIGGGTLLVLWLTALAGVEPSTAAGINLLYFLGCAPASLWLHRKHGRIERPIALWAAVGGSVAAAAAALLTPTPSPDWLRRGFGILLLAVGTSELWQVLHSEKNNG